MTKIPTGYVEMSGLVISDEAMELIKEWNNGYHIANIPKGEYGEVSKIEEEIAEFKDAVFQQSKIMALVELSDVLCAIRGYLEKNYKDITLADLINMSEITKRAFDSGERK